MFYFFFFGSETDGGQAAHDFADIEWKRTANKGEWSELYTLYKLLVDQNLFPVASEPDDAGNLRLPVLSVLRYTEDDLATEYRIDGEGNIRVKATGHAEEEVGKDEFKTHADELLKAIKSGASQAAFEITSLDEFRARTFCPKIKCFAKKLENGDQDKSDLYIVIHDPMTGQTPKQGFSIKSELGNPPTLLNATKLTNFRYKLSQNLSAAQVEEINKMEVNGHADIQGRVRAILNSGATLDFDTISPNKNGVFMFYENLLLVDSSMPEILARLLVLSYSTDTRRLDQLTDIMTDLNPLGFPMTANKKYYEAKVKRFITDVALGLLPSQPWEATRQSSGILVVTEKGDIDCYHVIYTAALEDYLFHDLKFETASAKRHGFGSIVCGEDGNQYFTLNLQLRFIR